MAKKEEGEAQNLIELHIRHRTEKMARFMRELKNLTERYSDIVDMITIDVTKGPIEVTPMVENSLEMKTTAYKLQKGNVYIIKGETPDRGFETFADVIRSQCYDCHKAGTFSCEALNCASCTIDCPCSACDLHRPEGLVLTRRFPKKVAQQYYIQTTPMIWLTQMMRPDVDTLNPNEIPRINSTLTSFVGKSKNGVILIEGLEYMITQNTFETVLKFVQHLHDLISPSKSCLLFLLDPLALEPEEVHLLQRNMTDI